MKFVFSVVFLAGSVLAQEASRFTFDISGGFTAPVGGTGRYLDNGWNLGAGAGVNMGPYFGALIQTNYNSLGINSGTLNNLGFPGGDVHMFSATLEPIVHLTPRSHVDLYVIGGGGLYHMYQEFTAPSVATITGYNPFFGFYAANVPTTEVLSSYSVNKPGANIGAGIAFGTKYHAKVFAEARYDHVFMGNNRHTDYLPVSFGLRW